MNKDIPILTSDKALNLAYEGLQDYLDLEGVGYKVTPEMLLQVLLAVSSQGMTVEQVCRTLPELPDATTLRKHLNAYLTPERLPELEQQLNAALQAQVPQRLWRKSRDIAIDVHEHPYYGRTEQAQGLWVRSRPKASTQRFYRVITAYVMQRGLRVTLAVAFMPYQTQLLAGLQKLLRYVAALHLSLRQLWLDRGFATLAVLRYLQDESYSAVVACPLRGNPDGQGTRALCKGRGSYLTDHTFSDSTHQHRLTLALAVCRILTGRTPRRRTPRHTGWQVYALIHAPLTPQQVLARYRGRFGIETSYRCANQVRGWTTSPNPVYRFVLLGLAFYLYNVWVQLVWLCTQVPRRGGRYLDTQRFHLDCLKLLLLHALEHRYGTLLSITAPAVPRP